MIVKETNKAKLEVIDKVKATDKISKVKRKDILQRVKGLQQIYPQY